MLGSHHHNLPVFRLKKVPSFGFIAGSQKVAFRFENDVFTASISNQKGEWEEKSVMVERTGIEPVTPTMSM